MKSRHQHHLISARAGVNMRGVILLADSAVSEIPKGIVTRLKIAVRRDSVGRHNTLILKHTSSSAVIHCGRETGYRITRFQRAVDSEIATVLVQGCHLAKYSIVIILKKSDGSVNRYDGIGIAFPIPFVAEACRSRKCPDRIQSAEVRLHALTAAIQQKVCITEMPALFTVVCSHTHLDVLAMISGNVHPHSGPFIPNHTA